MPNAQLLIVTKLIVYLIQIARAFGPLSFLENGPRGDGIAVGHTQRALCNQLPQTPEREGVRKMALEPLVAFV